MKKLLILAAGLLLISLNVLADDVSIDSDGNVKTGVSGAGNLEVTGASGEDAIVGRAEDSGAAAVYGEHTVNGQVDNFGILGDDNYGVYGNSLNGDAGYFKGDAHVTGNLTVGGFLIGPAIGDITAVNPGTGLSGGGTSGDVTLNANTTYLQRRVTGTCATGSSIRVVNVNGTVSCETDDVGITVESDPTVATSVKDGVDWTELTGIPAGFADGVDDTGTYSAGTGLNLSGGTTFNVNVPLAMNGSASFAGIISGTNSNSSGRGVSGSSPNIGGYFESTGPGTGVYGVASATGDVTNYGGSFTAAGNYGYGVSGTAYGEYGIGVHGYADATGAVTNFGGDFIANGDSGSGVRGEAYGGSGHGVTGNAFGYNGIGVYGLASSASGDNYGGRFESRSTTGYGVYGSADGVNATGVSGLASSTSGVNYGGRFESRSDDGYGVYGSVDGIRATGVYGLASGTAQIAVHGNATGTGDLTNYAGYFEAAGNYGHGIYSIVTGAYGVGVYSKSYSSTGQAGIFEGDVYIHGTLHKDVGSFLQPHRKDPSKEVQYNFFEGPEHAVFLRGTAELKDGKAVIEPPEHFRIVAAEKGVQVQVTPVEDCNGIFVASQSRDRIEVKELMGGTHDAKFNYFVTAVRAGFEDDPPIKENRHFKPKYNETAEEFEQRFSGDSISAKAFQSMLISNGTLTEDGKLNMATAKKLEWPVADSGKKFNRNILASLNSGSR